MPPSRSIRRRLAAAAACACACACAWTAAPACAQSAPSVAEAPLRAHLAFLADDLLEGRGTGQRGGLLTVRYLETQAAVLGLQPLPGGGYRQQVELVGQQTLPTSTLRFDAGGKALPAVFGRDVVFANADGRAATRVAAPLVFVGYGIDAPDERWNDFAGADVKGKVLVALANDPPPTPAEPDRFGSRSLTWYGRWTYKFEEAARQGAAGILLIHTTASASYPWSVPVNSFSHEQFHLPGRGNALQGWIAEDMARALFAQAGQDLDRLRARAAVRGFTPVPLAATLAADVQSAVRTVTEYNVAGIVPGSDPALRDDAVVYSAHWDHLGSVPGHGHDQPQAIWNGAVDNGSGSAALLAMAQAAVTRPARRTQVFLWPCAEEQGLLGSTAWVRNPPWPLAQTAADLNLDSMNFVGRTRDMGVAGAERSSLYAVSAQVAQAQGLHLAQPVPDLGGAYFRADHFSFARAGVPAFSVGSAVFSGDGSFEFERDQAGSTAKMRAFTQRYHQVGDRYDPAWDLSGMVQQAQFTLDLGYAVANAPARPTWKPGATYGAAPR